ncbi:cytochrome P450 [Apodospora peruviana]|uniref:Cytochrome P450 n=1 Tax=Apodospora peruviana TaxID=516989 RepID=A0AAE0HVL1_9PEZI|nr:cytochrome P450 [Apodospora peruviana]
MTIAAQLFSFPSLTLWGVVESLAAIKLFPDYYSSQSHLVTVAGIILINYAFGLVFWAVLYPRFFSPLRRIPGPKALLSAAYKSLIVKEGPAGDLFLNIAAEYPDQEMIALDALGKQIFVANPRLFADLLVHKCYDFAKPKRIGNFLRRILGDGLIIVEEDQHKFLRKNTMPAFHVRHIKDLYPMMWTKAGIMTKTLTREIDNAAAADPESKGSSVVELTTWASKVTLDIIGIAGMGRQLNVLEKASDPIQELYEELLEPDREKLLFAMISLAIGFPFVRMFPWKMNDLFIYLTSSLSKVCRELVKEKREAVLKEKDDHFDILSLLIKTNNFDDEVLKDQLLTFLAAGHETTASALTWAAYLLSKHPEIQTKLRDEVTTALGEPTDSTDEPPVADLAGVLKTLPYLNGVIQETLRLYPTVPLTMREALRDTQVGDQFIPKGTELIVSIWMINRSPELWGPDPGAFRPERWINADDGKPNQHGGAESNYDFMTFLHGPRSCIGQDFAKAEMRCLLASLVMGFTWDLAMDESKIVPRGVITIKPENGMYLRMRPLRR